MVQTATKSQLLKLINSQNIVIVEFWAEWSEYCQAMDKKLDEQLIPSINDDKSLSVVKIDFDHNKDFMQGLKIKRIPCIMVFHEGQLVELQLQTTVKTDNADSCEILHFNSETTEIQETTTSVDRIDGYNPEITNELLELIHILRELK